MSAESLPHGALAGVRVVEVSTVLMVPYASQLLGDQGAEVIKVESLEGDPGRHIGAGPPGDLSGVALNLNRNKRSLALDLKQGAGQEALHQILASSDVFLTNLRPSALNNLHLTYEQVTLHRPEIIYCRSHGYSDQTPDAEKPAYDDIIQAASGIASLFQQIADTPTFMPAVLADKVCGLSIANAVLAALYRRSVSGCGQEIEVPMFDTMLAFNLVEHLAGATLQPPLGEPGYARILTPHRRPFKTLDGWVVILPYSASDWRRMWAEIGRLDLVDDLASCSEAEVKGRAPDMYAELAKAIPERSTDAWIACCAALDIPASRVPTLSELVHDAKRPGGVLEEATHSFVGKYLRIRPSARLFGTPSGVWREAPRVGGDSVEILRELGYSDQYIQELIADGVTREAQVDEAALQREQTD